MRSFRNSVRMEVDTGSGTEVFILPVRSCRFEAIPYSRSGEQVVQLFDGRYRPSIDGWHVRFSVDWSLLKISQMESLRELLTLMAGTSQLTANLYLSEPSFEGETNTVEVTLEDAGNAIRTVYSRNIRNTPASISFISTEVFDEPPNSLTLTGS